MFGLNRNASQPPRGPWARLGIVIALLSLLLGCSIFKGGGGTRWQGTLTFDSAPSQYGDTDYVFLHVYRGSDDPLGSVRLRLKWQEDTTATFGIDSRSLARVLELTGIFPTDMIGLEYRHVSNSRLVLIPGESKLESPPAETVYVMDPDQLDAMTCESVSQMLGVKPGDAQIAFAKMGTRWVAPELRVTGERSNEMIQLDAYATPFRSPQDCYQPQYICPDPLSPDSLP